MASLMNAVRELAVLLVDDLESDTVRETLALERAGYRVRARRVQSAEEMAEALGTADWDVVLCDHTVSRFGTVAALGVLAATGSDLPLIVVSGTVGEEAAAAAIRNGAADFVSKNHLNHLASAVRTQLRAAELRAAQRHAEAQFRSAFDDAPFGSALLALGPDAGRLLRVNRALCEATGHTSAQLLGAQIEDLLHADDRTGVANGLGAVLSSRNHVYQTEVRLINAVGRESWFLFSVSYVRAPGGQDAVAHFVDIDARKRVEATLQRAHSHALEASRIKSEFVVNMSHELRTPLNGVVGLAGLLADTNLTADQSAYVAGIRSSGQALVGVIGGILDFSKIEAGTLSIDVADFEPAEVLAEVCELFSPIASDKGLQFTASVDEAVPDRVSADGGRIRQVLTNLAGNAVKFTDAGAIALRLSVENGDRSQLRFDVTDAGPGIDPTARPFEPFWQADSSMTRHQGGTGLGLAIAERMVELMNGRIHVASTLGGGSHFWFVVPCQAARSRQDQPTDLLGVRALVADDNLSRRVILARLLDSLGVRVTVVEDGAAALAELHTGADAGDPYRIAALDQLMSHVEGHSVPATVRMTVSLAATRVMLLTATPLSARPAEEAGADSNLSEPLVRSRLAAEIARVLGLESTASSALRLSGRGRLLLVEDDAINRLYAVDLLRREGWKVDVAGDGARAVELALSGGYDAILMDCQMPNLDGYRATEEIRRIEGTELHTPIVAVTAHATSYDRQRCLLAGMDGYVAKPFTIAQLDDALRRQLDSRQRLRATASPPPHDTAGRPQRPLPVLDDRRLAEASDAVRSQLVEMFADSARERIAGLAQAAAAGDIATVRALAHTLKGASATIGAQRMDQACDRLGKAAARGRADEMSERQHDLEQAFELTDAALSKYNREAANAG